MRDMWQACSRCRHPPESDDRYMHIGNKSSIAIRLFKKKIIFRNTNNWRHTRSQPRLFYTRLRSTTSTHTNFFYTSIFSHRAYLCVGVHSCLHSEACVSFSVWACNCPWTLQCVSVGLRVCVSWPLWEERRGNSRKKTGPREAWNVLGYITSARVRGKTQRGASTDERLWRRCLLLTSVWDFSHSYTSVEGCCSCLSQVFFSFFFSSVFSCWGKIHGCSLPWNNLFQRSLNSLSCSTFSR